MSMASCQVCGGSGFFLEPRPMPVGEAPPAGVQREGRPYDPSEGPVPDDMELVPCKACGGSGNNTGV
jgi:hypothetical protein